MSGVKGRSGRRKQNVEQARYDIIDYSWKLLGEYVRDETLKYMDRIEVAKMIVGRDISRKTENKGDALKVIQYMTNVPIPSTERTASPDGSRIANAIASSSDDKPDAEATGNNNITSPDAASVEKKSTLPNEKKSGELGVP